MNSILSRNNKENGERKSLKKNTEQSLPKKNILGQSNQTTLLQETETFTLDDQLFQRKREMQRNKKPTSSFQIKLYPCC